MSRTSLGRSAALMAGVAAAALCLPAVSNAQAPTQLPTIDATAADDPQATVAGAPGEREVSGETLSRRRASAADAMSLILGEPGMAIQANGGVSGLPVMRGLADERVLVTIDGVESTTFCPNHMNPPGSYVSPSRVDQISIQPSLSPVSSGGDNIAGVIAITTRPPTFSPEGEGWEVSGEAGASYRSVADGVGANLRLGAAGERLNIGYEGSWNRAENYRNGDGDPVRSTLYENSDQALTLAYLTDQGVISLRAGRQYSPYQGFPNQRMDLTENDSRFADLRYEASYGWGDLTAKASWRSVEHEMNFLEDKPSASPAGMPMNSRGRDLRASFAATLPRSDGGAVRLGVEAHRTDLDDWWPPVAGSMGMSPLTYWNINGGERDRTGAWAEWEAKPSERWTTLVGVRAEHVTTDTGQVQPYSWTSMMSAPDAAAATAFNALDRSRSDDNVDVTAKAIWRASEIATLEFGYARKTRTPSLYERYAWGRGQMSSSMTTFAGDANAYVGDPDLRPEVAHNLAAALRLASRDAKRELTVSAYSSAIEDYVDATKIADLSNGFVQLRYANVDARLYGVDVSGRAQLWEGPRFGQGTLRGTLSWVEGENRDSGDNLYHITPLTGRVVLEQSKGRWTHAAEVELVDAKDQVNALRREHQTDGYGLVHLRTSWKGERVRVDVSAENLFDKSYALPLGGVSFGDFKYGGQVGQIQALPGPGRSINIGLSVAF